jgi:hypothetical protein
MAVAARPKGGNGGPTRSTPPEQIANVPPPIQMMDMSSVLLQSIMEMQKSVSEVGTKTNRLVLDVAKLNEKVDTIRNQVSFVRGASWIIGILLTAIFALGIAILSKIVPQSGSSVSFASPNQLISPPSKPLPVER